jgi:antibiotic biosynthesis monooxygenase (ABM) superfamily enzyme
MEFIQELIASRNLVAWVILIVLVLVIIKLMKSLGTGFALLMLLIGIGFIMVQLFPGFVQPMVDFVRGGWLGE